MEIWPLWEYFNYIIWDERWRGQAQIKRGKPERVLTISLCSQASHAGPLRGKHPVGHRQREKVELWAHALTVVSKGRNGPGRVTEFKTGWVESFQWAVGIRAVSDCGTQP